MPSTSTEQLRLSPVAATSLGRYPPAPSSLQAGQLYRAHVAQVQSDGSYLLKVGNHTLRLAAGLSLVPGQELLIRMTTPGGSPGFSVTRVLPPVHHQAASSPAANDAVMTALQAMASRQLPLSGLLSLLNRTGNQAQEFALAGLQSRFSKPQELVQPQRLQGAILESGLLLEPRLAAATVNPSYLADALAGDFKLLLWRLLGQPGALDQELIDVLEGLLANISLRQLRSVRQAEDGHFHWSLELPLIWGDRLLPVAISLRKERGLVTPDRQEPTSWEVEFSLAAEPLGSLDVHIFLKQRQVSVSIEAERPATVQALQEEIETLRETLGLQGFDVETVVSRPASEATQSSPASEFSTVSELGVGR